MANPEHLARLKEGVDRWNEWRSTSSAEPDLAGSNLHGAELHGANLERANLSWAELKWANLSRAKLYAATLAHTNLRWANLANADLTGTDLTYADLTNASLPDSRLDGATLFSANLSGVDGSRASFNTASLDRVNLSRANLSSADFTHAQLSSANLSGATCTQAWFIQAVFVGTNLETADLTGARIHGISAWDLRLTGAVQRDLIITPYDTPVITVDDLEVAQFIYVLLNNNGIRKVIDTITAKIVLILGRFSPERKAVLDALRRELRKGNYLPVVFDFEKPSSRDLTETVATLAHMAKFVIADLTDATSVREELAVVVPQLPSVPVQPILLASEQEWAMFTHPTRYPWVLPIVRYETTTELLTNLGERVIGPAERQLASAKAAG